MLLKIKSRSSPAAGALIGSVFTIAYSRKYNKINYVNDPADLKSS